MTFYNVQVRRDLNFEIFVRVLVNIAVFQNATHCRPLPQSQWKMMPTKEKIHVAGFSEVVESIYKITWCPMPEDSKLCLQIYVRRSTNR